MGAFALLSLSAALPASAALSQTAVSFDSSNLKVDSQPYQFSLGYSFTTGLSSLSVTDLGYLNDGATGAAATHQLQIYQISSGSAASPLAGTALLPTPVTVTTSSNAPTYNTFSFVGLLSPVTLLANTSYEIVGNSNGNGYGVSAVNPVFNGITYGTTTYKFGTTTPDFNPNTYAANNAGDFGPNFKFAAVPEASTSLGLGLMLVLGGIALVARKKSIQA